MIGILKNKTVVGGAVIATALILGFVIAPAVNHLSASTTMVVRAKTDISAGTKITGDMLEDVDLGKTNLPSNITGNVNQVIGAYAKTNIDAHDIITGNKLSGHQETYDISDGQVLMSVTIKNLADGLSGKLQNGDIVTVFAPTQSGNSNNTASVTANSNDTVSTVTAGANNPKELQYVKLVTVTASNGQDVGTSQVQQQSTSSGSMMNTTASSGSTQAATATLLLTRQQAAILSTLNQGEIQLALVCRGSTKQAQTYLDEQKSLLSEEAQ